MPFTEATYSDAILEHFTGLVIFTEQDLKTSLRHLQQFCCYGWVPLVSEQICTEKDIKKEPYYYAESPFMIDHLRNIGMRKLDGIQEHCNTLSISCELVNGSTISTDRREKVVEMLEDTNGHPPAELYMLFMEYRWDIASLGQDKKTHKDDRKYETLINLYQQMCEESADIQEYAAAIDVANANLGTEQVVWWYKDICLKFVRERYLQEVQYVRTGMIEKGTQYVIENLRSYMLKYFVQNRFSQLVDKYATLQWCFTTVLRKTDRTECCNR